VAVISAAISPFRAIRDEVRGDIGAFVEVYVKASLTNAFRRDTKGVRPSPAGETQFHRRLGPYEDRWPRSS